MTTVEVLYHYAHPPKEAVMRAMGSIREVYGIRNIRLDESAQTVRVEYDATRLTAAIVLQLLRRTGLEIDQEISLLAPIEAPAESTPVA